MLSDHIPWLKAKFTANQAVDADVSELIEWTKTFACRIAVASLGIVTLAVSGALVVAYHKPPPVTNLIGLHDNGSFEVVPNWDGDVSAIGDKRLRAQIAQNLGTYAMACEGYYWGFFTRDDEICASMSSDTVNKDRGKRFDGTNKESPLVKYSDGTTVRIEVGSRIPDDADAVVPKHWRIRLIAWTRLRGMGEEKPSYLEAVATVGYGKPPNKPEYLRHNPLGFVVADWRVYREDRAAVKPVALQ